MTTLSGTPMVRSDHDTPHVVDIHAPRSMFARATALVRRIIGVPDYDLYRRHMAACHPGDAVLSEHEFAEERLVAKYTRPGQRCC